MVRLALGASGSPSIPAIFFAPPQPWVSVQITRLRLPLVKASLSPTVKLPHGAARSSGAGPAPARRLRCVHLPPFAGY